MNVSAESSASQEEPTKKSPYDDLSRDDLIKKCKGLLVIAQKAKQAKQELQTEIDEYKKQLSDNAKAKARDEDSIRTMQELVESLTEQKLAYITELDSADQRYTAAMTKIDFLSKHVEACESDIAELSATNLSLRKKIRSIESDNEDLVEQMSKLEAAANEQRKQLQLLEDSVDRGSPNASDEYQKKIIELNELIETLESKLKLSEEKTSQLEQESKLLTEKLSEETKKLESEKERTDKANLRLKSYHKKLVKCSSSITQLKNTKFVLMKTVKDYSDSIPKWQEEMRKLSIMLSDQFHKVTSENKNLKDKLLEYESNIASLKSNLEELQKENKILRSKNQELLENLETSTDYSKNEISDHLSLQVKALESEKMILVKEKQSARDSLIELEAQNVELNSSIKNLQADIRVMETKVNFLECENTTLKEQLKEKDSKQCTELKEQLKVLQEQLDALKIENTNINDLNNLLKEEVETLKSSIETPTEDGENSSEHNVSLQTDIMKLETKLAAYKQENSSLLSDMKEMRAKIKELTAANADLEEVKAKMISYKTENAELLKEMKEVNQVLKERGESISKKEKSIVEMERLIERLERERETVEETKNAMENRVKELEEDIQKLKSKKAQNEEDINSLNSECEKLQKYLQEKEAIVSSLQDEIEKYKQQASGQLDAANEDMSTSTISRAEDQARMKELDDTFEDKYTKLRIFALKLKKKANDLSQQLEVSQAEKARLEKLFNDSGATVNSAQAIAKELKDANNVICELKLQLEKTGKDSEQFKKTDKVEGDLKKIDKVCAYQEPVIDDTTVEESDQKRKLTDNVEVVNKQDITSELEKLKGELEKKESLLSSEIEQHKVTRENLEKVKRDVKKKSVLSLEMEDYERSMKDLTTKMEENKKKIVQMESTIDTQQGTITSLKTQIKLLEDQVRSEENQNRLTKEELHEVMETLREKDNLIQAKNDIIVKLEQDIETGKQAYEELKVELSSVVGEKEKVILGLSQDRAEASARLKRAETRSAELQDALKLSSTELEDLKTEFASYKVRAQAVLRQSQAADHVSEEQVRDELAELRAQLSDAQALINATQGELEEARAGVAGERRRAAEAGGEAARAQQRTALLHADLLRLTQQLDAERSQAKLQVATLTQCYKQQISELEARLEREASELRRQLERAREAAPPEPRAEYFAPGGDERDAELHFSVAMLPREEGEGSEAAPSPPPSKPGAGGSRSPVPLERLLEEGVPEDEPARLDLDPQLEVGELRRQLHAQLQRVEHVTLLLAESERECARHAQLAELLKTEVRRARGSQHAHNAQYMKNVTLKFLTLPTGDERCRLVPVLQKILSLSNEEAHTLQAIAKGQDPSGKSGWGSYLPWSGK